MRIYAAWVMLRAFGDKRGNQCVVKAYTYQRDSLVAQLVNSLPAMKKTQVQSLGQENHLEKEMATYSTLLAWSAIEWPEKNYGLTKLC